MKYSVLTGALLSVALMAPAFATDITVRDFAGKITIVDGNDGVEIIHDGENRADISDSRDEIVIDGGLSRKERDKACKYGSGFRLSINGKNTWETKSLKDYPDLVISVPQGSNLTIKDSSVRLDNQVSLGVADLELGGCLDVSLGDADEIKLKKSGSGEIEIGTVGSLAIGKSGAGDLEVDQVDQFSLSQSGSGEVEINRVNGPVDISKSGSGDVEIGELNGTLQIVKSGSGDVDIEDGMIPDLSIRSSGSGDVNVEADVGDAYVRASGSSDVYIKSISGSLDSSVSGSSDFSRGDD